MCYRLFLDSFDLIHFSIIYQFFIYGGAKGFKLCWFCVVEFVVVSFIDLLLSLFCLFIKEHGDS